MLLDEPELVHAIVAAVRARGAGGAAGLGQDAPGLHATSAHCSTARGPSPSGGAGELVVHARTKADGYRPPARWDRIALVREAVTVPVVANGEIWTVDDARRCLAESGLRCADARPRHGGRPGPGAARSGSRGARRSTGPTCCRWCAGSGDGLEPDFAPRHRAGRLKQWLNLLRRRFPARPRPGTWCARSTTRSALPGCSSGRLRRPAPVP